MGKLTTQHTNMGQAGILGRGNQSPVAERDMPALIAPCPCFNTPGWTVTSLCPYHGHLVPAVGPKLVDTISIIGFHTGLGLEFTVDPKRALVTILGRRECEVALSALLLATQIPDVKRNKSYLKEIRRTFNTVGESFGLLVRNVDDLAEATLGDPALVRRKVKDQLAVAESALVSTKPSALVTTF